MTASGPQCLAVDVPVEGDANLLTIIADAQRAHREAIRCGVIVGTFKRLGNSAELRYQWEDSRARVDIRKHTLVTREAPGKIDITAFSGGYATRSRDELLTYQPSAFIVRVFKGNTRELVPGIECHPQKVWWHYEDLVPWEELLRYKNPRGEVERFQVQQSGTLVTIRRIHADRSILEVTADQTKGFNIVRYDTLNPAPGQDGFLGETDWVPNGVGGFYPKSYRHGRRPAAANTTSQPIGEGNIHSFSLLDDIDDRQFDTKVPANLPVGTAIEEWDASGKRISRRTVGGESGEIERSLKQLARDHLNLPNGLAPAGKQ